MNDKPIGRKLNIIVQEAEGELLVYDLSTNKALCLNQTSALVYQLCDGKRNVAEIADTMSIKLKTIVSEDLVWLALDNFKKDNLLEESKEFVIDFNGLNRRQLIKKIGLASMVALPIVASLIAPSAAMAQSRAVALGGVCPPACDAGLQCRSLTSGVGSLCCVPVSLPGSQTFAPGATLCNSSCSNNPPVCCSGSQSPAPTNPFCTNFGLVTCVCNP